MTKLVLKIISFFKFAFSTNLSLRFLDVCPSFLFDFFRVFFFKCQHILPVLSSVAFFSDLKNSKFCHFKILAPSRPSLLCAFCKCVNSICWLHPELEVSGLYNFLSQIKPSSSFDVDDDHDGDDDYDKDGNKGCLWADGWGRKFQTFQTNYIFEY